MLDLDYIVIKTLFKSLSGIKVGDLKKFLNLPHSTLGSCIKRLKERAYVNYEPYHEIYLTSRGIILAKELNRHNRLIEVLLFNELGLSHEEAHKESEKFSLLLSCDTINKICEKYEHPRASPCGVLILSTSDCVCEEKH